MKRLVYTPLLEAYIFASQSGRGIVNVTNDIVSGSVTRNVDAVSTASLTLQNRGKRYNGIFSPMDRIVIFAGRVSRMQIFSGYLDSATYYQIYPGTATVTASCPLKLLQNIYFDPGLWEVIDYFTRFGWVWDPSSGVLLDGTPEFGPLSITGGLGDVLKAILIDIGGFGANDFVIQNLPAQWGSLAADREEEIKQETADRLDEIGQLIRKLVNKHEADDVGVGGGSVGGTGSSDSSGASSNVNIPADEQGRQDAYIKIVCEQAAKYGIKDPAVLLAVAYEESARDFILNTPEELMQGGNIGDESLGGSYGWWQFLTNGGLGEGHAISDLVDPVYASNLIARTWAQYGGKSQTGLGGLVDYYVRVGRGAGSMQALAEETFREWYPHAKQEMDRLCSGDAPADAPAQGQASGTGPHTTAGSGLLGTTIDGASAVPGNSQALAAGGPDTVVPPFAAGVTPGNGGDACGHRDGDHPNWQSNNARDYMVPAGTAVLAVVNGVVKDLHCCADDPGGWIFYLEGDNGSRWAYLHMNSRYADGITEGMHVTAGTVIGHVGGPDAGVNGSPHLHLGVDPDGSGQITADCKLGDPEYYINSGAVPGGSGGGGGGAAGGGITDSQGVSGSIEALALQAGFFSTQFRVNDYTLSNILGGEADLTGIGKRAYANDVSLFEWVQTACQASGRSFMSLPDGRLYFFYPDYFGLYEDTPYWVIMPIEITDFSVQLTDRDIASHVFLEYPFLDPTGNQITIYDQLIQQVASVTHEDFSLFMPPDAGKFFDWRKFIQRFGIRPINITIKWIRHPVMAWFMCWQEFLKKWSQQFDCRAKFTFMPELYPGSRVEFRGNHRQKLAILYVEQVTHTFDRSSGFFTDAVLTTPHGDTALNPFAIIGGQSTAKAAPPYAPDDPDGASINDIFDPPGDPQDFQ